MSNLPVLVPLVNNCYKKIKQEKRKTSIQIKRVTSILHIITNTLSKFTNVWKEFTNASETL